MSMDKNAQVQMQALHMGEITPLAPGEITRQAVPPGAPPLPDRAWEYWQRRAGF